MKLYKSGSKAVLLRPAEFQGDIVIVEDSVGQMVTVIHRGHRDVFPKSYLRLR